MPDKLMPAVGHITNEERELIRDNVILLMMLEMIDHNRKQLENSGNLMKPILLAAADRLIDLVHADILAIKRQLRNGKVKWWDKGVTDDNFILSYNYLCRGYEGVFAITRDVAKTQLSIKFGEYFALVTDSLKTRSNNNPGSNALRTV